MSKREGLLITNILNGYRRQDKALEPDREPETEREPDSTIDDIAIDPALTDDVEEVPSSPLRDFDEQPIAVSSQISETIETNPKKRVNLKTLLSGYSKKPKQESKQEPKQRSTQQEQYTRSGVSDIIVVEESPVKSKSNVHVISDSVDSNSNLTAAKNSNIASFLNMERGTAQKRSKISKQKEAPARFPKIQHTPRYHFEDYRPLQLQRKKTLKNETKWSFDESEYVSFFNATKDHELPADSDMFEPISYLDDTTNTQLWTSLFKPKTLEDVLIDADTKFNVKQWFDKAFELLTKKTDRSALYSRKIEAELDNFIVDNSFLGSDDDSTVTPFIPLIILYGDVGKNTLVDVIMTENDAQVFEINCSMNRAKKDIYEMLHDFATTKYVKDTRSKGIILFDDVDVLLTESDKFFWNSVHATLLVSRRPVAITCRDYRFIPSNLLEIAEEQNSIFNIKTSSKKQVKNYLWRCLQQKGIEVDNNTLNLVIKRNNFDIRKCLMDLQWICTKPGAPIIREHNELIQKENSGNETNDIKNITDAYSRLELTSSYDFIVSNIEGKSFLKGERDPTLNYAKHQFESDQDTIYDIIWDFAEYLWDPNHNNLLPWEKQVYSSIQEKSRQLLEMKGIEDDTSSVSQDRLSMCMEEMFKFLRTRVNTFPQGNILNMVGTTRSSRRKTAKLKDYRLKSEDEDDSFDYESMKMAQREFHATHKTKDIGSLYLPTVYQIAYNESEIKRKNISLFNRLKEHHGPDCNANDIINEMVTKRLILAAYYKGSPQPFIDAYI